MREVEHARRIVEFFASRLGAVGVIEPVAASEVMRTYGQTPGHYGKAYGQAVSLLDAACLLASMPWLGRLVVFDKKANDVSTPWSSWQGHMAEIAAAPRRKAWSAGDLQVILSALPVNKGASAWWSAHEKQATSLLERALAAARSV